MLNAKYQVKMRNSRQLISIVFYLWNSDLLKTMRLNYYAALFASLCTVISQRMYKKTQANEHLVCK